MTPLLFSKSSPCGYAFFLQLVGESPTEISNLVRHKTVGKYILKRLTIANDI
jgi:hypothetical protein